MSFPKKIHDILFIKCNTYSIKFSTEKIDVAQVNCREISESQLNYSYWSHVKHLVSAQKTQTGLVTFET